MSLQSNLHVRPWFVLALIFALCLANYKSFVEWRRDLTRRQDIFDLKRMSLVAHAGGLPNESIQPNSVTAMEASYQKGHRFFEIDLSWTLDNTLVGIHDWSISWAESEAGPGIDPDTPLRSEPHIKTGLMTLENACQWRKQRPQARLIMDPKSRHIEALLAIRHFCGTSRIIPQVHNKTEYQLARELGFHSIILTLYRASQHPDYNWEEFIDRGLIGITIPRTHLPRYDLSRFPERICVMTHTVNELNELALLSEQGVCGIYTDILMPDDIRKTQ